MAAWVWALVGVACFAVLAALVWLAVSARRTRGLRRRFGPEYDRATETVGGRRRAEAELAAREKRRSELTIRPLAPAARERYARRWETVQAQFVDSPSAAVAEADALVTTVMSERGYPVEDFERRAADVSVDHPVVVDDYRRAHEVSLRCDRGTATTEDLRQAMQHYRSLFDELLHDGATVAADEPLTREGDDVGENDAVAVETTGTHGEN